MIETVLTEARALKNQFRLARCGIGFGGPVDFERFRFVAGRRGVQESRTRASE